MGRVNLTGRIKGFGLFWWDFLVGDSPELFIGAVLILGIAFGLRGREWPAAIIVTACVVLLLSVSVWRGRVHK